MRRDPIGNIMSNPIENPIGNRIGNPIGNPIGHPIMLLTPFGLQLDGSGSKTFPKGIQKAAKSTQKNPPDPPNKFNKQTPQIGRPVNPKWTPKGTLKSQQPT